jgi:hypothetical protein
MISVNFVFHVGIPVEFEVREGTSVDVAVRVMILLHFIFCDGMFIGFLTRAGIPTTYIL